VSPESAPHAVVAFEQDAPPCCCRRSGRSGAQAEDGVDSSRIFQVRFSAAIAKRTPGWSRR